MVSGEQIWVQVWLELEFGSDLVLLCFIVSKVDGGWLFNGQKIWSLWVLFVDMGFGLFCFDFVVEWYCGFMYFMFDLKVKGVIVCLIV